MPDGDNDSKIVEQLLESADHHIQHSWEHNVPASKRKYTVCQKWSSNFTHNVVRYRPICEILSQSHSDGCTRLGNHL